MLYGKKLVLNETVEHIARERGAEKDLKYLGSLRTTEEVTFPIIEKAMAERTQFKFSDGVICTPYRNLFLVIMYDRTTNNEYDRVDVYMPA